MLHGWMGEGGDFLDSWATRLREGPDLEARLIITLKKIGVKVLSR